MRRHTSERTEPNQAKYEDQGSTVPAGFIYYLFSTLKNVTLSSYTIWVCVSDILKLFNPNLVGPARSRTVHGTPAPLSDTGLNLAVTGHNTL